jgi:hypothetical protein
MNDKYYAVHQVCGPIYGVGLSPDEAIADANQYLDEPISADDLVDRRAANDGDLKWSNPTGHLVKVVKLPTEVKHDKQTDTTPVHAGI